MATHSTVHQWNCVHAYLRTNIHDLILAYIWSWDAGSTNHSIHHSSIRCRQCIHATSPHLAHGKGNPTTLNANTHQSHNWENQDGWSLTICMVWCFLPTVPRNVSLLFGGVLPCSCERTAEQFSTYALCSISQAGIHMFSLRFVHGRVHHKVLHYAKCK